MPRCNPLVLAALLITATIVFALFYDPGSMRNGIQIENPPILMAETSQTLSTTFLPSSASTSALSSAPTSASLSTSSASLSTSSASLSATSASLSAAATLTLPPKPPTSELHFPAEYKLANQKRLGILTIHTPEFYKWSPLAIKNKMDYANKHNYRFYVEHGKSDTRHPVWSKISSLIQRMKEEDHEWYWALDLDTVIMNFTIPAHEILDDNYNVIVAKDCNGYNAGSFFIKNSEWSLRYLQNGKGA